MKPEKLTTYMRGYNQAFSEIMDIVLEDISDIPRKFILKIEKCFDAKNYAYEQMLDGMTLQSQKRGEI